MIFWTYEKIYQLVKSGSNIVRDDVGNGMDFK